MNEKAECGYCRQPFQDGDLVTLVSNGGGMLHSTAAGIVRVEKPDDFLFKPTASEGDCINYMLQVFLLKGAPSHSLWCLYNGSLYKELTVFCYDAALESTQKGVRVANIAEIAERLSNPMPLEAARAWCSREWLRGREDEMDRYSQPPREATIKLRRRYMFNLDGRIINEEQARLELLRELHLPVGHFKEPRL